MTANPVWPGAAEPKSLIAAVCQGITPRLKQAGFARSARTWRRSNGRITQVVNLEASPWNAPARDYVERTRAALTLNVGVHVDGLDDLIGWPASSRPPTLNRCHVQFRAGQLIDGHDRWWTMSSHGDVDGVIDDIDEILVDIVLPWLSEHKSLEAIRSWYDEPPAWAFVLAGAREHLARLT